MQLIVMSSVGQDMAEAPTRCLIEPRGSRAWVGTQPEPLSALREEPSTMTS